MVFDTLNVMIRFDSGLHWLFLARHSSRFLLMKRELRWFSIHHSCYARFKSLARLTDKQCGNFTANQYGNWYKLKVRLRLLQISFHLCDVLSFIGQFLLIWFVEIPLERSGTSIGSKEVKIARFRKQTNGTTVLFIVKPLDKTGILSPTEESQK